MEPWAVVTVAASRQAESSATKHHGTGWEQARSVVTGGATSDFRQLQLRSFPCAFHQGQEEDWATKDGRTKTDADARSDPESGCDPAFP